jgi:hypothetical protein
MPSPLYGVASLLDLAAQLNSYNVSSTEAIADLIALHCDVASVSSEMRAAIEQELASLLATKGGEVATRR